MIIHVPEDEVGFTFCYRCKTMSKVVISDSIGFQTCRRCDAAIHWQNPYFDEKRIKDMAQFSMHHLNRVFFHEYLRARVNDDPVSENYFAVLGAILQNEFTRRKVTDASIVDDIITIYDEIFEKLRLSIRVSRDSIFGVPVPKKQQDSMFI